MISKDMSSPGKSIFWKWKSCFSQKRRNRIEPIPGKHLGFEIVEVRPKRWLRITHFNSTIEESSEGTEFPFSENKAGESFYSPLNSVDNKKSKQKDSDVASVEMKYISDLQSNTTTDKRFVFSNQDNLSIKSEYSPPYLGNATSESVADMLLDNQEINNINCFSNPTMDNIEITNSVKSDRSNQRIRSISDCYDANHRPSITSWHPTNRSFSVASISEITKAVLFFVHGVGGSADTWQSQIEYFRKEGYEIVAPDLIGHGFSDAPNNPLAYEFNEITLDILALFDKYSKKYNILIGHSYGSSFVTVIARKRPHRVTKLVLVSGGGPLPLFPQPGVFCLPTCILTCLMPFLVCAFQRIAFHGSKVPKDNRECAFDVPTHVLRHTMNGQIWNEGDEDYHRWLTVPTLLIYGMKDKFVTLEEEQLMHEVVYCSELKVIEDASHMVMMEVPDRVNAIIHAFLIKDHTCYFPSQKHSDRARPSVISTKSIKSLPGNIFTHTFS